MSLRAKASVSRHAPRLSRVLSSKCWDGSCKNTGRRRDHRSDNGPELVAHQVRTWLGVKGVQTLYIEPGSPWQNAKAESFNGRLRDECLNMEWFRNLNEAQVIIESWRHYYNEERPHSSLQYKTPTEFRREYERAQAQTSTLRL